jgi:hypothetical protein
MKYNRLLFISIPIGILLSGCLMSQRSATISSSKDKLHTGPLPYFVRHNQGLPVATPTATAARTPYITAHLVQDNDNQSHVEYWITDKYGPGNKHSKNSNNEDPTSSLFTTIFPVTDLDLKPTKDGEVIIQATATDGRCYAWKSKSKNRISADCDVLWKPVNCN